MGANHSSPNVNLDPSKTTSSHSLSPFEQMKRDAAIAGIPPPAEGRRLPKGPVQVQEKEEWLKAQGIQPTLTSDEFILGEPETREEVEQLRRTTILRLTCASDHMWHPSSYKNALMFGSVGLPWFWLAPRKWHRWVKGGPAFLAFFIGVAVDYQEGVRLCNQLHPLPIWSIERAKRISAIAEEIKQAKATLAAAKAGGVVIGADGKPMSEEQKTQLITQDLVSKHEKRKGFQ